MYTRSVWIALLLVCSWGSLRANSANGDARLEALYKQFIAPCCWRENLLVHHSPKADELRAEIKRLVGEGKTDAEIKNSFVKEYSARVLSMPEGASGQLLSWTPVLAALAGLGVVLLVIKTSLRKPQYLALLAACSIEAQVRRVDPPALEQSGMAFLAQGPDGTTYLSWIDPLPPGEHALRFSRWNGVAWSKPETVSSGRNWFVNWGDFPAIAIHRDGTMYAHWLARPAEGGKWGYGIHVARRDPKTRQWRETVGLSTDNKEDYAGFLSFVADGGTAGAIYLSPPQSGHHDEQGHRKTVRFVSFRPDGAALDDREIDADACSCCQTAIGVTSRGLLAAYRDHAAGEIRDISVVRFVDGAWTAPRTLHPDGWRINGCPTEGPTIAAAGNHAAVAWMTRAQDVPRIQLALSEDGGVKFGKPLRLDDGDPLGRPVIAPFENGYLAAWIEKTGGGRAEVRVRRVSRDGRRGPAVVAATVAAGRAVGFPKIAVQGDQVLVAWRDDRVRVSLLSKQNFILKDLK